MTASSTACTPLFLNAEPQVTRQISFLSARWRRPALISSLLSSAPSRYLFSSSSLASTAASTILARHFSHSARMSAGISRYSKRVPWVASSQQISFIWTRSTTPAKRSSAPIGSWMGTGLPLRRVAICSTQRRKFAPARSILLTKASLGTPYLFICRQTVSDCGWTPDTAQ